MFAIILRLRAHTKILTGMLVLAALVALLLVLPERASAAFIHAVKNMQTLLRDDRSFSALLIGLAVLLIVLIAEWNTILNHIRIKNQSLASIERAHPRLPGILETIATIILTISFTILFFQFVHKVYSFNTSAVLVLGQNDDSLLTPGEDFLSGGIDDGTNRLGLSGAEATYVDATNGHIFVADINNRRVLVFDAPGGTLSNSIPDYVLGQPDFHSNSANLTSTGMDTPVGLAVNEADNLLFVVDQSNQRVLVYDLSGGITSGMAATYVLGQPTFTSNGVSSATNEFSTPTSVVYDAIGERLFVGEYSNRRVSVFDLSAGVSTYQSSVHTLTTTFEIHNLAHDTASNRLFVSGVFASTIDIFEASIIDDADLPIGQITLSDVTGIAIDAARNRLFAAQSTNNRVLVYDISVLGGETQEYVLGQDDLVGVSARTLIDGLSAPGRLHYSDDLNYLLVGDSGNNRIMIFHVAAITDGEDAVSGIGQYDDNLSGPRMEFTKAGANNGPHKLGMYYPEGVQVDTVRHRLFVSEWMNNRVLVYNLDSNNNLLDRIPDNVIGPANFYTSDSSELGGPVGLEYNDVNDVLYVTSHLSNTTNLYDTTTITDGESEAYELTGGLASMRPNQPIGVSYDDAGGRLFVADRMKNRVLVYSMFLGYPQSGDSQRYIGQPNVSTTTPGNGQNGFEYLNDVLYDPDSNYLYVADNNNRRIMVFDVGTSVSDITNGMNASYVLGQPDFTTYTAGTTASKMSAVGGFALDRVNRRLFVGEGNRILIFDIATVTNGESAIGVLGQPSFTTNTDLGVTQSTFSAGLSMDYDPGNERLYVPDVMNNRVLAFDVSVEPEEETGGGLPASLFTPGPPPPTPEASASASASAAAESSSASASLAGELVIAPVIEEEVGIDTRLGTVTMQIFRDIDGDAIQDVSEQETWKGIKVSLTGITGGRNTIELHGVTSAEGRVTFVVPVSSTGGYIVKADLASEPILGLKLNMSAGNEMVVHVDDETIQIIPMGLKRDDLLAYTPCLTIGDASEYEVRGSDAVTLLQRLENVDEKKVTEGLNWNSALMSRRAFFALAARTQCVEMVTDPDMLRDAVRRMAKIRDDKPEVVDLKINEQSDDSVLFYSLYAAGYPVGRYTKIGLAADLNAPISREEVVTMAVAILKLTPEVGGASAISLPTDVKAGDPIADSYAALKRLSTLPKSFSSLLGAGGGISPTEAATLMVRTAFQGGKIELGNHAADDATKVVVGVNEGVKGGIVDSSASITIVKSSSSVMSSTSSSVSSSSSKTIASSSSSSTKSVSSSIASSTAVAVSGGTFLSEVPGVPSLPCLVSTSRRAFDVLFTDVKPGEALDKDLKLLLPIGVKNEDQKTLWLVTGTDRPTEYGVEKAQTSLNRKDAATRLEVVRALLLLSCRPPQSATTVAGVMAGAEVKVIQGSADQRVPRDRFTDLPRDKSFESRVMYRSQDVESLFNMSLFAFAPSLLSGDTQGSSSKMNVEEAAELLTSALLAIEVKAKVLTPLEASQIDGDMTIALQKELLGNVTLDWRTQSTARQTVFTREMLIKFLASVVRAQGTAKGSVPVEAGSTVSKGMSSSKATSPLYLMPATLSEEWWFKIQGN